MRREIKFRAWDKTRRRMFEPVDLIQPDGEPLFIRGRRHDEYELLQFTGLKDGNGVEIFEGDIVTGEPASPNEKAVVEFRAESSCFCIQGIPNTNWLAACHEFYRVIGNIYENRELLKEVT